MKLPSNRRGSSPLARGLRRPWGFRVWGPRIIPARAGFTSSAGPTGAWKADHPRSRGVYTRLGAWAHESDGSSPLARGLPDAPAIAPGLTRIIPARAGFTRVSPPVWSPIRDHPRSRGVYSLYQAAKRGDSGSSPLARGLLKRVLAHYLRNRIIPARAGFTGVIYGVECGRQDHPRSRGVYVSPRRATPPTPGSSPLARGLRYGEG